MTRISFGSPEALAVLEADKKREAERQRREKEGSEWELSFSITGIAVACVKAHTRDEALAKVKKSECDWEVLEWNAERAPFSVVECEVTA